MFGLALKQGPAIAWRPRCCAQACVPRLFLAALSVLLRVHLCEAWRLLRQRPLGRMPQQSISHGCRP
jgi:hypothetical protein